MEAAVAKVKADAKRSDKEKSAALSEVAKLEALVAQLKQQQQQQKPQSRDQESAENKVRACRNEWHRLGELCMTAWQGFELKCGHVRSLR